ncbi:MAG: triose-phosphate isomerase [Terriglobales bacterium]
MRKKVIAANWKMYKTPEQARAFFEEFLPGALSHKRDEIVVCPPYPCIAGAVAAARETNVRIGAQNMGWAKEGAFTGEVSAPMLLAIGCTHVILGHSERRQYFAETDDTVNAKLKLALECALVPIVCVGEVIQEREAGLTEDILRRQVSRAFREIDGEHAAPIIVAYEPVWAIGTGKTATPEMAADAHRIIRAEIANAVGKKAADDMRILYGGSVKPDNAHALMSQTDIDGALVGGASLDPKSFTAIVNY